MDQSQNLVTVFLHFEENHISFPQRAAKLAESLEDGSPWPEWLSGGITDKQTGAELDQF